MTFYCTQCWAEVPASATRCPRCGDDIVARQARSDYTEKLIAALRHPEPTTPVRAAWILGERRERAAVEPLCRLVRDSSDAFLVESAVEALGKIGDARAAATLEWARRHPSPRVRRRAEQALTHWPARTPSDTARTKQAREETASVLTTASLAQTLDENRLTTMTTTSVNESAPRETGRVGTEGSMDNLAPGSDPLRSGALHTALHQLIRLAETFSLRDLQPLVRACHELLQRRNRIDVAVFGRFKAGKSSFLNHLVGRPVLPVGVVPLTAVITRLRPGEHERATVHFLNGETRPIALTDTAQFVDEKLNPENRKQVAAVEVDLPELKALAPLEFVDTPGLGSAFGHNTEAALNWLPNVAAALVAVSSDAPLSERDLALLETLQRHTPRIVLLLTKADLLTEPQRDEVLQFVREQVRVRFAHRQSQPPSSPATAGANAHPSAHWPVFFYSIKPEYAALKRKLVAELLDPLRTSGAEAGAEILRHKLLSLAHAILERLQVGLAAARQAESARQALAALLAEEHQQWELLNAEFRVLSHQWAATALDNSLRQLEPARLALRRKLQAELSAAFSEWHFRLPDLLRAWREWLQRFLHRELAEFSQAHRATFCQPLHGARLHLSRALRAFQDRLAAHVRDALGITLTPPDFTPELREPDAPPIEVGYAFDIALEIIAPLVPLSLFRRPVERALLRKALWEADKNLSRLAADWARRVGEAIADLTAQAERHARAELDALDQALSRAPSDAAALQDAIADLEALRARLTAR